MGAIARFEQTFLALCKQRPLSRSLVFTGAGLVLGAGTCVAPVLVPAFAPAPGRKRKPSARSQNFVPIQARIHRMAHQKRRLNMRRLSIISSIRRILCRKDLALLYSIRSPEGMCSSMIVFKQVA